MKTSSQLKANDNNKKNINTKTVIVNEQMMETIVTNKIQDPSLSSEKI